MTNRPILIHGGIIQHGTHKGKTFGFPTANVIFDDPEYSGTYAGRAIIGGGIYRTAVYANPARKLLEAHILGLDLNLYGKWMTLELYEKVAGSEEFTDEPTLKQYIGDSVDKVQEYFAF